MSRSVTNIGTHLTPPTPYSHPTPHVLSGRCSTTNFLANHRQNARLRSQGKTCSSVVASGFNRGGGFDGFYETQVQVRDYELDQHGVVNNAVYARYCHQGRHELLVSLGINADAISLDGEALALTDLSLKFIAPLRGGDKFLLRVKVDSTAARMICEHFIYKIPHLQPILEARGTAIWLNNNYRPVRIPTEVRSKLTKFIRCGMPK